ncbi:MAG: XRE family transcriptional regulator [Paracoccaceae bacterium]
MDLLLTLASGVAIMVIRLDNVKGKVIQMDSVGDRLRSERERLGLSQAAFAALAGASKPSQVRYEKGERYPDGLYFQRIASKGADVLFILTGEKNPVLPDRTRPMSGEVTIDDQEYAPVGVYDVDAAAGNGIIPLSEAASDQVAFTRSWLMRHGIAADLAGLVRVRGDSMAPTIPDGAYVLVDFRGKADWSHPGIYLIRHEEAIVVKRLQQAQKPGESWVAMISDNPVYPPVFINDPEATDFQPIARVRVVFSTV